MGYGNRKIDDQNNMGTHMQDVQRSKALHGDYCYNTIDILTRKLKNDSKMLDEWIFFAIMTILPHISMSKHAVCLKYSQIKSKWILHFAFNSQRHFLIFFALKVRFC